MFDLLRLSDSVESGGEGSAAEELLFEYVESSPQLLELFNILTSDEGKMYNMGAAVMRFLGLIFTRYPNLAAKNSSHPPTPQLKNSQAFSTAVGDAQSRNSGQWALAVPTGSSRRKSKQSTTFWALVTIRL
eukprot:1373576-Amorphochlora_amoeboformis.AAC.1